MKPFTAFLFALICLDLPLHPPPYTIETYSVREDGAGHACDCAIGPCGTRAPGCMNELGGDCLPFVEPNCFLTQPDQCGNVGACSYLDIHAYPAAMMWRVFSVANDACFDTDWTETRVGWGAWWRAR